MMSRSLALRIQQAAKPGEDVRIVDKMSDRNCNLCQEEFPSELDYGPDHPRMVWTIPVETLKGNFCSDFCRSKAMYEAQDEDTKQALRQLYLGLEAILNTYKATRRILEDWDVVPLFNPELRKITDLNKTLSPDGQDTGMEDDVFCFLVAPEGKELLKRVVRNAKASAMLELAKCASMRDDSYICPEYIAEVAAIAKGELAEAEQACALVEGLETVI
jgi:hypothetical protein